MISEEYSAFARVYDRFMEEAGVPYDQWAQKMDELIGRYGVSSHTFGDEAGNEGGLSEKESVLRQERDLVLDVACGTGQLSRRLRGMGYDVMGVDISEQMLDMAARTEEIEGRHGEMAIRYICQDMRQLDLYCTVGTVVCSYDAINYLTSIEDLVCFFKKVNNFLYPGGMLIFDFNTLYKYRDFMGRVTFAVHLQEDDEGTSPGTMIWDNTFFTESDEYGRNINQSDLTFFIRDGESYRKYEEVHLQRGYTLDEMRQAIESAGMSFIGAWECESWAEPTRTSERILVAAGERGKPKMPA